MHNALQLLSFIFTRLVANVFVNTVRGTKIWVKYLKYRKDDKAKSLQVYLFKSFVASCLQIRPEQLVHEKKTILFIIPLFYNIFETWPPSQAVNLAYLLCYKLRNICRTCCEARRYIRTYKYLLALERECDIVYLCRTYLLYMNTYRKVRRWAKAFM